MLIDDVGSVVSWKVGILYDVPIDDVGSVVSWKVGILCDLILWTNLRRRLFCESSMSCSKAS